MNRSLASLAVLAAAAACTTIVGLPDLPPEQGGGAAGSGTGGTAGSGAGGAALGGGGDTTGGRSAGGSGEGGDGSPATGGSSSGGAAVSSGGTGGTGGASANGGTGGAQGGASGGSSGGSDNGGSSGSGGSGGGTDTGGGAGKGGASGGGNAGKGGAPSCTTCGGSCVYVETDEEHCGACDYSCVNGRECVAGRCTPAWQPIATSGAPAPRSGHAAAFVAGKFVVLGGNLVWDGPALASAGAYDPVTDSWSAVAPLQTARCLHRAISTGTEIYTFGGLTVGGSAGTIGPGLERFVPDSGAGAWTTVTAAGAPAPRYNLNMAWTGSAVLIYGGSHDSLPSLASGGRFVPSSADWFDASCELTFCNRTQGAFFRDGNYVRFMGGEYNPDYPIWNGNGAPATSGLAYDIAADTWSTWPHPEGTTSTLNGPQADDGRRIYFPTGGSVAIYDRETGWLPNDVSPMPSGLCASGAAYAWSGSEMIGWSGDCSPMASEVGGRYQPPAPPP